MHSNQIRIIAAIVTTFFILSGFFSSCYYDNQEELYGSEEPCDTTLVTYTDDILPILTSQCYNCHSTANAELFGEDNDLEGYDNLMGYVVAGDPENSLFYASVAWLTGAVRMPRPEGSDQISDCNLALIRNWILQGASNN